MEFNQENNNQGNVNNAISTLDKLVSELWEFLLEIDRCAECGDMSVAKCEFHSGRFRYLEYEVSKVKRSF